MLAILFGLTKFEGLGPNGAHAIQAFRVGTWHPIELGSFFLLLLFLPFQQVALAAISYGVVQDLRGRKTGTVECISRGIATMSPAVGVVIMNSLLCGIGLAATLLWTFAFPRTAQVVAAVLFVFIYMILWVAVPVAVVERSRPFASLIRSHNLTEGNRRKALGALLIVFGIFTAVRLIATDAVADLGESAKYISEFMAQALGMAYFNCVTVVGYCRLRVYQEDVGIDEIAKTFN